jgi:hypothetical protein
MDENFINFMNFQEKIRKRLFALGMSDLQSQDVACEFSQALLDSGCATEATKLAVKNFLPPDVEFHETTV